MATTPSITTRRKNGAAAPSRSKRATGNGNGAAHETHDMSALIQALKAAQAGDFSVRLDGRGGGVSSQIAQAFNALVERNHSLELELERLNTAVGRQGKLNERASLGRAEGGWANSIRSVNNLIGHLVQPMNEVSRVITAVARGDLTQTMVTQIEGRPLRGEFRRTADTVNQMVGQLGTFASEVTRVAREVGTEGKLGGQARVKGVAGTWKDLTDNVNSMAENLTSQVRNIAEVTTAVARGDLSKKITVDVKGEILELKNTINTMVDQLNAFASEVTRVAREVGTEGKLGGQARVKGVAGTWKDLTDNVNSMAENLTSQVRNIAEVTTALARGDLSKKITVDVRGEILELKNTINTMVDQLNAFASEVTRVAREVGTEGKLGGQAHVRGVAGTWKDLTDNVNSMAENLTSQVRNIAEVTTAVARGDLSKKITVDVKGEILELKNTINTMVDQLNAFASEVSRVAREVGTEGKLGGQARVGGVAGTWKDLTQNVNSMAENLTSQVRNIAEVTTAVARGDLSKKITVDVKGEILELKNTINTMVDQLNAFASEVTRVAREVGTEGKLGGQARVEGVAGTWKDLTDNVNSMAENLTSQVRNIAEVTTAVARGDLSKKITVDVKGEILELKNAINTMVDQLNAFASEVTRVAREVGTEGKLGGQARVEGVAGTWKDLTDNVNLMAENLTGQVRNIAEVTTAVANGDLSKTVTVEVRGELLALKNTINTMVDQLNAFASEVTRVAREVGTEGKLGGQAHVRGVAGTWKDLTDNVNSMAENLTSQVRNIAEVTTAVANGDLSRKITVEVRGEILELKNTINRMVDQLNAFASEVTRVAREVGTEGKLGGQAQVRGVAGIWKDLTDNVNTMAENLTAQVRGIARVVTAVARGDLKRKLGLEAKGEIAVLADTINDMIDTLALFADQVTSVAREVGVEGRLGGQAQVPGASGTWRDLTDNVNQLAANLTTQVRAIAEVATAVTEGDLTRSIAVEARGEVAALKDNINEMIRNLKETTQKNQEQDWLNSNLARIGRNLQGQRDRQTVCRLILSELARLVDAQHGAFFVQADEGGDTILTMQASYAYKERKSATNRFRLGEGLVGQAALERERILLTNVPTDYVSISSGLGEAKPLNIVVLPVLFEDHVKAVIELASFNRFSDVHLAFLEQLGESIGIVLNTIEATMRTEQLLRQSQSLTERLQSQQDELQQTNEELEEKARLLTEQKAQVEVKNREVELARQALEEKAEQLALTSKYKSEFLANMSHELRTPLNSLLVLARLLAENPDENLSDKQVEYARTIHSSGTDLLGLINEILDLSKIESGKMAVDVTDVSMRGLASDLENLFRELAEDKGLRFDVKIDEHLPRTVETDGKRLKQVLRNLLSNAFKFTEAGSVELAFHPATSGWADDRPPLDNAAHVVAFSVKDTGIGIAKDKQKVIFEAFQQADGTTSRKYGGTGLGLSISREIAFLLGGDIRVDSELGKGTTFTLFIPLEFPEGHGTTVEEEFDEDGSTQGAVTESALPRIPARRSELATPALLVAARDADVKRRLVDVAQREGWRGIAAEHASDAVQMARRSRPAAIVLDLEDENGWGVLDALKRDPAVRHVPVLGLCAENSVRALRMGAKTCLAPQSGEDSIGQALREVKEFTSRATKRLLVVEDDERASSAIVELCEMDGVEIDTAATGAEALEMLRGGSYDCIVADLGLPDVEGLDFLDQLEKEPELMGIPVIVHTGRELSRAEENRLRRVAETIVLKDARSPERLLAEVTLYLHRPHAQLSGARRQMLEEGPRIDPVLQGGKVLIVDDDVRNVFALTSALEQQGMIVSFAENGREALEKLENGGAQDIVLMDIMMPEMDGFATMRAIRQREKLRDIPIVALTAKAMQGDREACLEAGANDYITKPVDLDQLLSLMRVWLYK